MTTIKNLLREAMPYLYKKKPVKKKKKKYFKGTCSIKKCKRKAKAYFHCKLYCQEHFDIEVWKEKSTPRKWN